MPFGNLKRYLWVTAVLVTLLSLLPAWQGNARIDEENPVLSSYLVTPKNDATMMAIADKFEVHHRHGDGFEVIVPAHRASELLALAPGSQLLQADISSIFRELQGRDPSYLAGYHSFAQVEALLREFEKNYPDIAKLEEYGKSKEGRPLYALKISDNVALDEEEPELLITSATHGDELISVEVVLGLMEELLKGHQSNDRLTQMVENRELYFVPVVNPDGFTRKQRYSNGVDPNREYPYPGNPDRTPNACIAALMKFFHARNFVGSMDYHSSGRLFMYPWAYTSQSPPEPDATRFREVTRKMAATNGYRPGQISQILYVAKGSSADYYYWKKGTLAIAVEIGNQFVPPSSQIPAHVKENAASTWAFVESFN